MKRIPELDALRAIAAVAVVLYHAFPYTFSLGWSAVDLFFVLSGYLITQIIIEHHRRPGFLRAFYLRRTLRIWPVYFVVLAGCLAVNRLSTRGYPVSPLGLLQHLTFTQNVQGTWGAVVPPFVYPFGASWSVAVEEQFYLVWPFVILALGTRVIVPACLLLIATFIAARHGGVPINVIVGRGDALAFGCMLAALLRRAHANAVTTKWLTRLLVALGVTSGGLAALYAWRWWGDPVIRWQVPIFVVLGALYFSLVGLTVLNTGAPALAPLRWRALRLTGHLSYSLYMLHMPILEYTPLLLRRLGTSNSTALSASTWGCMVLLPILCYVLLERPILHRKDRVRYGIRQASAGARVPAVA